MMDGSVALTGCFVLVLVLVLEFWRAGCWGVGVMEFWAKLLRPFGAGSDR